MGLIEGIDKKHILTDKAYDTDEIIAKAHLQNMQIDIPPKKKCVPTSQKMAWRGIITIYAKNTKSFLAAVQILCISLWAKII